MSDDLDTAAKVGGGVLGGGTIIGFLLKMVLGNQEREIAELRAEVAKLRERQDGMSNAYRPELQGLQTRVGRLEGASGLVGDGAAVKDGQ